MSGALAAGLALLARDRGGPPVLGQLLQFPMLDDRCDSPSAVQLETIGMGDGRSNRTGWAALLGPRRGTEDVSPYAAPARAADLSGLAPAFIEVGSVEALRDEGIAYATRLGRAGGTARVVGRVPQFRRVGAVHAGVPGRTRRPLVLAAPHPLPTVQRGTMTPTRITAPAGVHPSDGYAHAVTGTGRIVALAGQLPLAPDGTFVGAGDPEAQARQMFENLRNCLAAAGATFANLIRLNYFLTDIAHVPVVLSVRDEFIDPAHFPASTVVQVTALYRPDLLMEIDALALLD